MINPAPFCNTQARSRCTTFLAMMNTQGNIALGQYADHLGRLGTPPLPLRPSALCMVSAHELQELKGAIARGVLPPDFEAKLGRLAEGDLTHCLLARNCRLLAALLLAARDGSFKDASLADRERLLRLLAYVRKDDDAIPDYKPGGFMDDQQEVRTAMTELDPLLKSFKAWRLQHQVPGMWSPN